jgi:chromosome segregation protein
MLYLDSLVLHNFKSFRHASIKFKQNFNCIVGPNGSGKSNICDSLLFVLGESSLKRLRVTSTQQLINDRAKPKSDEGTKRAYVKLNFAGDEQLEIARIIKSNNKVGYRLNGKHVTRQEMLEVMRAHKSEISEVNTITQGEITTMVTLNPKERRELIEVAAGIQEFNEKKAASMNELEKVEAKTNEANILLNERLGFLNELAKEKEDAEHYIALTNTIKRINYTLLRLREDAASGELSGVMAALREREGRQSSLSERVSHASLETEALLARKAELSKKLNERSMEVSATSRLLEDVGKEIAVAETQLSSSKAKSEELGAQTAQLQSSKKKITEQLSANEPVLKASQEELASLSKRLEGKDIRSASDEFELINKHTGNQRSIDALLEKQNALNGTVMHSRLSIESIDKETAQSRSAVQDKRKRIESIGKELASKKESLASLQGKVSEAKKQLSAKVAERDAIKVSIDSLYSESVEVRERIATLGARTDRSADALKKAIKGFYGRAYELCSYEAKYANAVNAAASSRFGYFVVDSIDVAKEAIAMLKAKQLGRATFIPLKEVVAAHQQSDRGLVPIIECVSFDKKYERAFSYIFTNTYLVESMDEAKRKGIGGHRFVTIDGELVETSGVVTGGSLEALQSPAVLTAKLKGIEEKRAALNLKLAEIAKLEEQMRKEAAGYDAEALGLGMDIRYAEEGVGKLNNEIRELASSISIQENERERLRAAADSSAAELDVLAHSIDALKKENERIYSVANSPERRGAKASKGEIDAIKAMQARYEELTVKIATTGKESELLRSRLDELEADIKKGADERKSLSGAISELSASIAESRKKQEELQQKIKGHDAKSAGLYKEVEEADSGIAKLAQERGKLSSDLEKLSRDSIELQSRRSQLQTRIVDIKAELMSYQGIDMLDEHVAEKLEAQLAVSKSELERLGNVNLKATEVYMQKSRDAEEAKQKLGILDNEKSSIIAMINEIEAKKLNIFTETLNVVNENFKKLYNYIFDDQAYLYLENAKDPFNTGLMIHLSNKLKASNSDLMSGGEKALLMLMLIFAIHMKSPRSFYIFDEIDTMLDKENSKKLSKLLGELSKKSQMVVVSHNDSLITAADTAIGVVRRDGESQVVGLQLTEASTIRNS